MGHHTPGQAPRIEPPGTMTRVRREDARDEHGRPGLAHRTKRLLTDQLDHAREHGIEDESILRAIRYHPTGAPDMDRLGLVLFVADYTEPSRDYPGARELRRLALEAPLEDTAVCVCRNKIEYVQGKGRTVHSRSLRALESLERRSKELRTTRPL